MHCTLNNNIKIIMIQNNDQNFFQKYCFVTASNYVTEIIIIIIIKRLLLNNHLVYYVKNFIITFGSFRKTH
jgi:hypothetical protein